jgi:DNA-binding NarL/FixJ family response regulator
MKTEIRVAILEDHQSIIDGYIYRLSSKSDIKIVGTCTFGSELKALLSSEAVDVLLMDLSVPISPDNKNIFPVRHELPKMFSQYPALKVIIISVFNEQALIRNMIKIGASGYIMKDDQNAIKNLARIVKVVAGGGIYLSSGMDFEPLFCIQ